MGVRIALGARMADVVWMVVREALALVLLGMAMGVPAGVAVARLQSSRIAGLLHGLSATDPASFAVAAVFLFCVAAFAAYLPARRVSRIDPIAALRAE
jgi:ABC-type antimicrobial peptide transport system permease subunit